jgi:hypothetical protein
MGDLEGIWKDIPILAYRNMQCDVLPVLNTFKVHSHGVYYY